MQIKKKYFEETNMKYSNICKIIMFEPKHAQKYLMSFRTMSPFILTQEFEHICTATFDRAI